MKKPMKWILPILLVILLIVSAGWYMFVYDTATMQHFLGRQSIRLAESGNYSAATWLYNQSTKLAGDDQNAAVDLAEVYKSAGNYTKAESTLIKAIAEGSSTELYTALCQTFVEQDKLLDAVNLFENISDPEIAAELDALRPAAPTVDYESGFYNQYINLSFSYDSGTLYVTTDGQYPSTAYESYSEPVTLPAGETKVYAIVVGDNGLVSPVTIGNYTIAGIVEEVTLSDEVMEADIREKLMFGADTPIYTSDLWTITEYVTPADAAGVGDLKYLTQLKSLTITGRSLGSLSFLSGMTQLEELNLVNCSLPDELEYIGAISTLKSLTISGCSVSSVAKLEGAVNLTYLDLSSNAIGNISALSGMTQLTSLNISHNAVTDLSSISSLTQLTELDASYNSIGSLSPVTGCTALKSLNVTSNALTDLSPVSSLTALTHLYAGYNQLTDVSTLAGSTGLVELNISHNALEDISALSTLVNLTHFDFSYNDVKTLPALPTSCALVVINGEHNYMEDISALAGMENLNYVYMDYNNLTNINALAKCPVLQQVNVYGTNVSDVSALLNDNVVVNYDPT